MVPLVCSLFNIWPPSIVDFGPSLHFFFIFWISSLILDILVLLVLYFCSWWLNHVDKLPSWMVKRCCASILGAWELLMVKRCAFQGFVDVCFYRMVVKRWFVACFFLLDKHLVVDYAVISRLSTTGVLSVKCIRRAMKWRRTLSCSIELNISRKKGQNGLLCFQV